MADVDVKTDDEAPVEPQEAHPGEEDGNEEVGSN